MDPLLWMCFINSAALDVNHRVCFRSLHAAEFQRQTQVAAAAAAAVAGFSTFNLHSSATGGADRRYFMPQSQLSKSSPRTSLVCYRVTGDEVGQFSTNGRSPARYLQMARGNVEDDVVIRRTYP